MAENTPSTSDIEMVFDFWQNTLRNSNRGIRPVLTDKRKRIIGKAISMYGVDACKEAILGCSMSEWHMGENPRGKKYDSIELILRDAEKIEQFAGYYHDQMEDEFEDFLNE